MSKDEKKPGLFGNIRKQVQKRVEEAQELIRSTKETAQRAAEVAKEHGRKAGDVITGIGTRIKSALEQIDTSEIDRNFAKYRSMFQKQSYQGKPAVLVIGRTGAGKSTLINQIIGQNVAQVGAGEPITQDFKLYGSEQLPIELYDSPGWEGGKEKAEFFLTSLRSLLTKYDQQIQLIWYVIDAQSTRLVDFEIDLLTNVLNHKPVCLLLTKCDVATDEAIIGVLRAIIGAKLPSQIGAYEIAANPLHPLEDDLRERFSYEQVLKASYDVLGIRHN